MQHVSVDRMAALQTAFGLVRRGGTVSISGVYAGWVDDLLPLAEEPGDPLGLQDFATHRVDLGQAPQAYARFQAKEDCMVKVLFDPSIGAR